MNLKIFFSISFFIYCFSILAYQDTAQVVIIGSGPAGLTAGIYTARSGLSTIILEGTEPGGTISLSNLIDNFPGFDEGISGLDLGDKMRQQARKFGSDVRQEKVVEVDLSKKPFVLMLDSGNRILAESLIVACGANPRWLGLESEKTLIGNGVYACALCDGILFKDQDVVVIGGGDTALENVLYLTNYASKITVINRRENLNAAEYLQKQALTHPKINFLWDTVVEDILDPKLGEVNGIMIRNILTNERQLFPCKAVFVSIGHVPNSTLFKKQLKLDEKGYVITAPFSSRTNIPGVFAAGDIADPRHRQSILAAGSGALAGIEAYNYVKQLHGDH